MMRMRTKNDPLPPVTGPGQKEWELRPGGMLVQKRVDSDETRVPPPTIRVRVKYGSVYHELHISSSATFGELKKMLSGPTGLHHQDMKVFYKDKERDSRVFLDTVGVKDKSKLVVMEDPISQEKRVLEMRRVAKLEKAAKSVAEIGLEVDRLAGEVSSIEKVVTRGEKVDEKDIMSLIELLMNQLLKLDGINADGDVKVQRKMQVTRVQKYVETLDMLKIKNAAPTSNGKVSPPVQSQRTRFASNGNISSPVQHQQTRHSLIDSPNQQEQPSRHSASSSNPFLITTQWETFESTMPSTSTSTARPAQPSFTWDLL